MYYANGLGQTFDVDPDYVPPPQTPEDEEDNSMLWIGGIIGVVVIGGIGLYLLSR